MKRIDRVDFQLMREHFAMAAKTLDWTEADQQDIHAYIREAVESDNADVPAWARWLAELADIDWLRARCREAEARIRADMAAELEDEQGLT